MLSWEEKMNAKDFDELNNELLAQFIREVEQKEKVLTYTRHSKKRDRLKKRIRRDKNFIRIFTNDN